MGGEGAGVLTSAWFAVDLAGTGQGTSNAGLGLCFLVYNGVVWHYSSVSKGTYARTHVWLRTATATGEAAAE